MKLSLVALAKTEVRGSYEGRLPTRMRFLHPDAAMSFRAHLARDVVCSDMYRSAEASLLARRTRKGSQRPGYSGHNYGLSIDIDVDATMANLNFKKPVLDAWMGLKGWTCHRLDGRRGFEEWHYNFGVVNLVRPKEDRSSAALERRILMLYGSQFALMPREAQTALATLGLYRGDIDGKIGPLSREAIFSFQRTWQIPATGKLDTMTTRTLVFVTAER